MSTRDRRQTKTCQPLIQLQSKRTARLHDFSNETLQNKCIIFRAKWIEIKSVPDITHISV